MRFWRSPKQSIESSPGRRGISLRALDGASREELCNEPLANSRNSGSGNVDRIGVWLAPGIAENCSANGSLLVAGFRGCVWDAQQETPPEWESLGALEPLPVEILAKSLVVEKEL